MKKKKHLSSIANDVILRCAELVDTSVDALVEEFGKSWNPEMGEYSRKLVEFCCSRALSRMCCHIEELINDGTFSRFTFDMMLAWEVPSSEDEDSYTESIAKEKEDRTPIETVSEQDEIPLFYTDLMPLLNMVNDGPGIGEDAFVWLGTLVPLVCDMVNGRFTFETLTASTADRLQFPAYDRYLKEIDKSMKNLQTRVKPKGVELADDEFILHVEGTASTQRVIHHIGGKSQPGRLTLTNYALYFEANGIISYEDAIKIDLSKNIQQSVKPAATGPFGAPIFDKAIVYESADLPEPIVLEFPELTSSTRRDHWLALLKEVMLLHQFLYKYDMKSPTQAWEMHARTILGVIRLHSARAMLIVSPPDPKSFLILALYDELPKGDYVLEELAVSLKKIDCGQPCSASSILRYMNSQPLVPCMEVEEGVGEGTSVSSQAENLSSLENVVNQVKEEAKEMEIAKATTEGLKEEGISDSVVVLMELLKPLKNVVPWFKEILTWQRPATTLVVLVTSLVIIYKEWVGKAVAVFLLWVAAMMIRARKQRIGDKCEKIVVCTSSDQMTIESIVSAQQGLQTAREMVQFANITILKIWAILLGKTPKHTDTVIMVLTGLAIVLAVVPLKYILMALVLYCFIMTSKVGKHIANEKGNRRIKEWTDSIPVTPVEVVDSASCPVPDGPNTIQAAES